jgi:hypothetical protein
MGERESGSAQADAAKAKRDKILKIQAPELKGSTATTLNKVAAVGGAVTGVTSTITSGAGAFATDFGSMKNKIDACLNSLNISQN